MNFKLIWHDYERKISSRQLRPAVDELRPMTKEGDLPLFANFYGFLLINEDSVTSLNQALKYVPMEVDHRRFRPNIVVTGMRSYYYYSLIHLPIRWFDDLIIESTKVL